MIFGASAFLYLLPLAGLPILFHFMLKLRKRQVVFSTLMFLRRTDPRLNSRRKIQQWLLLLMRILLIAFLLLALSRPIVEIATGFGETPAVIAIVDNSASMNALAERDKTKLEYAVAGARKLISSVSGDSQAAVLLGVEDPLAAESSILTTDTASLLEMLDDVTGTEAAGDFERTLSKALDLIAKSLGKAGAIHIFTDLQTGEWGKTAALRSTRGLAVGVRFHRIESMSPIAANATIAATRFPEETILPGHPYSFEAIIKNTSSGVATVRLNSIDSRENRNTENITLQPKDSRTVSLKFTPAEAGIGWIKLWLEGDDFASDNTACIAIPCKDSENILFAGSRREFGVLPLALSPSGDGRFTGLATNYCPPAEVAQQIAEKKPILAVVTWSNLQGMGAAGALEDYVRGGGNLLVINSVNSRQGTSQLPGWVGAEIGDRGVYKTPIRINVLDEQDPFWTPVRKAGARFAPGDLSALAFCPLKLSEEYTSLLGVDFKRPVIARKRYAEGNIYVASTAFDPSWNSLPRGPFGVVVAQRIALDGTSSADYSELLVAGEGCVNLSDIVGDVEIMSLIGDSVDFRGTVGQLPAFCRTGAYVIKSGKEKFCVSVRAADSEGRDEFIEDKKVPIMGEVSHKIAAYDNSLDFDAYSADSIKTTSVYVPLLLLATLALLAEGLLANPAVKKYKARAAAVTAKIGRKEGGATAVSKPVQSPRIPKERAG